MAEDAANEEFAALNSGTARTAGEKLYLKYGLDGARGEAAQGFPGVAQIALPVLKKALQAGRSRNDAGAIALLHLIARGTDTNMAARGGTNRARAAAKQCEALLRSGTRFRKWKKSKRSISRSSGKISLLAVVPICWPQHCFCCAGRTLTPEKNFLPPAAVKLVAGSFFARSVSYGFYKTKIFLLISILSKLLSPPTKPLLPHLPHRTPMRQCPPGPSAQ